MLSAIRLRRSGISRRKRFSVKLAGSRFQSLLPRHLPEGRPNVAKQKQGSETDVPEIEEQAVTEQAEVETEVAAVALALPATRAEILAAARTRAYNEELALAREDIAAASRARDEQYRKGIQRGLDPKEAAENLPEVAVMDFGFYQGVSQRAEARVKCFVLIDTPDDRAIRLNSATTLESGRWLEVSLAEVGILRDCAAKGQCTIIVKPVGWEPPK